MSGGEQATSYGPVNAERFDEAVRIATICKDAGLPHLAGRIILAGTDLPNGATRAQIMRAVLAAAPTQKAAGQ